MSETAHRWSPDRPGERPEDDALGRREFAQRMAKELRGWRQKDSLVVSLNGDWGSGKTTLVNLLLHYITEQSAAAGEAAPVVVRFNPWQWSGQNMLLEAFFSEIGEVLGRKNPGKTGAELAGKWKRYGALSGVGRRTAEWVEAGATTVAAGSVVSGNGGVAVGASSVAGAAKWAKNLFSKSEDVSRAATEAHESAKKETLSEVRDALKQLLLAMPAPLVVVVDDIDRLTKEQVRMMMQLVKANADFANVVYLLLYQKNIVAHALDEVTCEKGQDFLKKIVQVELEVPGAPDHKLREMLGSGVDKIWRRARFPWDVERKERWRRLFEDAVWPYFETPRDVKRFLGVLDFYFEGHTDGDILAVNATDLVLVETLRMFDPDAFDAVRRSFQKGRNVFIEVLFGDKEAKAKFALSIDQLVDGRGLSEREMKRLRALLYGLFPQASEHGRDSSDQDMWDRDYRICHEKHFAKYFQLQASPGDVPARFIAQFFDSGNDRAKCRDLIQESIKTGVFKAALSRLWIVTDDFPHARIEPLVGAMIDMVDDLPDLRTGVEFDAEPERELMRLAARLLMRIGDAGARERIFLDVIESSRSITGAVGLLAKAEPSKGQNDSVDEKIVGPETMARAKEIIVPRIWQSTKTDRFWDLRLAAMVIYRLSAWTKSTDVQAWLKEAIAVPEVARKFLRHMLQQSSSTGSSGSVLIYSLSVLEIEAFVDLQALIRSLEATKLDALETIALEKLRVALGLKAKGQAYGRFPLIGYHENGTEITNPRDLMI